MLATIALRFGEARAVVNDFYIYYSWMTRLGCWQQRKDEFGPKNLHGYWSKTFEFIEFLRMYSEIIKITDCYTFWSSSFDGG